MKKATLAISVLLLTAIPAFANNYLDSLYREYNTAKADTTKYDLLFEIIDQHVSFETENYNPDKIIDLLDQAIYDITRKKHLFRRLEPFLSLKAKYYQAKKQYELSNIYYDSCIRLAEKYHDFFEMANLYYGKVKNYFELNLQQRLIESLYKTMEYYKKAGSVEGEALCLFDFGNMYRFNKQNDKAIEFYLKSVEINNKIQDSIEVGMAYSWCAWIETDKGNLKSAEEYLIKSKPVIYSQAVFQLTYYYWCYGKWFKAMNRNTEALEFLEIAAKKCVEGGQPEMKPDILSLMAEIYISEKKFIEAKKILGEANFIAEKQKVLRNSINVHGTFSKYYEAKNQPFKALEEFKLSQLLKDSLNETELSRSLTSSYLEYQYGKKEADREEIQRKKDEEEASKLNRQKLIAYASSGVLAFVVLISFLLYRNNKHKQRANALLQQQKERIESTLTELKSTQAQLIQSEKMASLGELTAGIAHEIQNPLNFVNNFSEVNKELLTEMKDEMNKGNLDEANLLANDVIENQEKINHHGKRADAIVKGMLQHSRSTSVVKEPTDINKLADEYLRLSYHGLRAKDKAFNATLQTDFDTSIGKINIIPQDIGRVLLNLYNNAFYAVMQKKNANENYDPTVSVSTKKLTGKVEIRVRDNGDGIPQKVIDKIFQPFFTTKPTGQGTGLGLSLSYDIIKAHSGEIKVDTTEGKFTEFVILLPITV